MNYDQFQHVNIGINNNKIFIIINIINIQFKYASKVQPIKRISLKKNTG